MPSISDPPTARLYKFPLHPNDSREVVIAQMQNHLNTLMCRNGDYAGRNMFIEAAVAVMVRYGLEKNVVHDVRVMIEEAFDEELDRSTPTTGAA